MRLQSCEIQYSSEDKTGNYPKYYKTMQDKLKLEQQKLSRKVLKSNNWYKQKESNIKNSNKNR